MKRLIGKSKVLAVFVLLLAFVVTSTTSAYARDGRGGRSAGRGDGRGFSHGNDRGFSRGDGHKDRTGAMFGALAVGLVFGSIFASMQQRETVVVAEPAYPRYPVVDAGSIVINVPNARGWYTAVMLVRQGNGYVGPQGEYYAWYPTVAQLQVLYGH